jgi:hypothetical protein
VNDEYEKRKRRRKKEEKEEELKCIVSVGLLI